MANVGVRGLPTPTFSGSARENRLGQARPVGKSANLGFDAQAGRHDPRRAAGTTRTYGSGSPRCRGSRPGRRVRVGRSTRHLSLSARHSSERLTAASAPSRCSLPTGTAIRPECTGYSRSGGHLEPGASWLGTTRKDAVIRVRETDSLALSALPAAAMATETALIDIGALPSIHVYAVADLIPLAVSPSSKPAVVLIGLEEGEVVPPHATESGLRLLTVISG